MDGGVEDARDAVEGSVGLIGEEDDEGDEKWVGTGRGGMRGGVTGGVDMRWKQLPHWTSVSLYFSVW